MDAERRTALAELLTRADAAAMPGHPAWQFDRDELYAEREAVDAIVGDARRAVRERA